MTNTRLAYIAILLFALFAINRVTGALFQCSMPAFNHSTSCFVHDVITGEDL